MSSELALREGTPIVPGTPADRDDLKRLIRRYVSRLDVVNRLRAYGTALQVVGGSIVEQKGVVAYLLELDIGAQRLTATSFTNPVVAAEAYSAIERAIEGQLGKDAVLVSVESVTTLQRAYPNYFLDTAPFLDSVEEAIA
jgi:hypothetical protein